MLLNIGSKLPPQLKGRVSEKIFRRLTSDPNIEVFSNLGLSSQLRWRVPVSKSNYAYGSPWCDVAERATLDLALCLSKHAQAFIDVGANYGIFSAAIALDSIASLEKLKMICVEPDPGLAERLRLNFTENQLNVEVVEKAVSDKCGQNVFYANLSDDSSGSLTSHFTAKHQVTEMTVSTITLEGLIKENNLEHCLIKIDVEGAGKLAWDGLRPSIDKVDYIILEVIGPEAECGLPDVITNQTGWSSYYIEDYTLREVGFYEYQYRPPFWNWLFCKQSCSKMQELLPERFSIIPKG